MQKTTSDPISPIEQTVRQSVSQAQLRQWMQFRPQVVAFDLVKNWGGILLAFAVAAHFPHPFVYAACFVWISLRQYALFIMGHDGMHFCLNSDHAVNDRISRWLIYGPLFMALEDGRKNHLEHHKTLGTAVDPDRYLHIMGNKNGRFEFLLFLSGLATFGKTVLKVTPLGHVLSSIKAPNDEKSRRRSLSGFIIQRIPVLITHPIIFSIFVLIGVPWYLYPLLWVAPIYFVFVGDEIRAFCDHAVPRVPDEEADAQRLVSFVPGAVEAAFFSPHNMCYHAEHHIWPGVPYYNRPLVHDAIKDRPEITVRRSYLHFLVSVYRSLPLRGRAETSA